MFLNNAVVIISLYLLSATSAQESNVAKLERTINDHLASSNINLSIPCIDDFTLYLQQLEEGATWALNMFDSSGKPESGVLKGGHTFLGFYSQCIDALKGNVTPSDIGENSTINPDFSSKYCLSTMRVTPKNKLIKQVRPSEICHLLERFDLTFAVCAPSTCNEQDVAKIAALSLSQYGCTANVTSTVCKQPTVPFAEDGPAVAVAVVLAIMAAVVLGATLFDSHQRKNAWNCENRLKSYGATNSENPDPCVGLPEPNTKCFLKKAFLCFSLLSNGRTVFGSEGPESSSIRVLHGLRFFSMAWVILIHSWTFSYESGVFRDLDLNDLGIINFLTEVVFQGTLAIDTFFFMGGLVLAYSTLRQLKKTGGRKNWLLFYAHRYFRTMPMLMIVVAICAFLMRHFGNGPRWNDFIATYETNCRISWWTYLLYIQNFVLLDHQCLGHTWYSAADFQMYLISPPILYVLYKKPRVGVAIIGVLCLASITLSAAYSSLMVMRFTDKDFNYNRDVYNKPYFRISPYLLGMLMGLFLSEKHGTLGTLKKRYVYLGWLLCAFCLLFAIFGPSIKSPPSEMPWYGTITVVSSSVWAVGIGWIVYACLAGCGGIFNSVLSSHALEPLSKLTFSTYIIQSPIVRIFFANMEDSFYYSCFLESYFFAGNLLLCYAASVVVCLFIELPLVGLERLLLGRK
ncbi:nose resistant to fluoxetine protein 6-like [Haemaphysalis longicornis]